MAPDTFNLFSSWSPLLSEIEFLCEEASTKCPYVFLLLGQISSGTELATHTQHLSDEAP